MLLLFLSSHDTTISILVFLQEVKKFVAIGMGGRKPSAAIRQRGHAPSYRSHHIPAAPSSGLGGGQSEFFVRHVKDFGSGQNGQSVEELQDEVVGGEEDPIMSMWGTTPLAGGLHGLQRVLSPPAPFQSLSLSGSQSEPSDLGSLAAGVFSMDLSGGPADNRKDSEVMKYIKKLEVRIENLELQNDELKAEVHVQRRRSDSFKDSPGGTLKLNAATPEFRPLVNTSPSPTNSTGGANRARSKSEVKSSSSAVTTSSGGNSSNAVSVNTNPGLNDILSKLNERLATLEGRQSSIQKKIACFDRIFGPSVPNWQKNVKDLLTRVGSVSPIGVPMQAEHEEHSGNGSSSQEVKSSPGEEDD